MRYIDDLSPGAPEVLDEFIQHGIQADLQEENWNIQYLVRRAA